MQKANRPTFGLALSGSGNRTTFYVGFLDVFKDQGMEIDYISACSGGSIVAAAFACGEWEKFKQTALNLGNKGMKALIGKGVERGGLYSLDGAEEEIRKYTKSKTFEEVRPQMTFLASDIETGELVNLCMGDIARAARISCTLPFIFEPVKWGGRTLVDGGLLNLVPLQPLRVAGIDVIVGVNMRGTKHIYYDSFLTAKKMFNGLKKYLLIDQIEALVKGLMSKYRVPQLTQQPRIFTVLGKSMDLAIEANKQEPEDLSCDLMVTPEISLLKGGKFDNNLARFYFDLGRKTAVEHLPKIRELINSKS